jgi:ligand-binding sensor domain-containing protein/signal transduction histidine kinase
MVSHEARIIGFVLWGFLAVCLLSAKDQPSNGGIRLPISDATDRVFVPISVGKETSHAWVGQIAEDNQGFLWFATSDGLYRYDGYQVRPYGPVPTGTDAAVFFRDCCRGASLSRGMARYALFKDHSGKIWIGAGESLYKYDPETERFSHLPFAPGVLQGGMVRNVNQDRSGMIWLATIRGLARYNPANGETARFLHNESDLASLTKRATLETKDGTFWVATSASVDVFDRQTGKVTQHFLLRNPLQNPTSRGNPSVRLLEDHSGTLWIVSARDGLAFVDRQRTKLTFVALARGSDLEPGAWAILEDRYGALWIGTEQGLLQLDCDRKRFVRYRNDPADPSSLPADWVLALLEDHEDGIWVGTANAGVARLSEHTLPFRRYRRRPGSGGPFGPDYVFTAFEDSSGEIWAGTMGAINHIDLKTGRYTVQPVGENTQVSAITEDRSGQFWIGTIGGSLFRSNSATRQSVVYRQGTASSPGCVNNEVRALFVDHLGTLWVGARDSLCSFDPATNRFRVYTAGVEGVVEINAIAEDAAGILWIGCRYGGVQRFDPVTGKFTIFRHSAAAGSLSNDVVTSILADRSGTIWAGTLNGLNRLDAATGKFTVYRERDGLPSSIVNGVVEDANGDLWITTSYGLSHFRRRSGTFYNYYRSDGVLDDLTGAWKGSSGQIFFGSYSGLTALSPDAVDEKLFIPRVVLTNFQISDKPVPVGADSPLKESISVTHALNLSHSQNTLSFEFAALSYADPERTRYRYRLEGLDSGWNEVASTQHFTRYSKLAPGKYIFHVEARVSHGNWTENGATVRIVILPPWWAIWQFRVACLVFFLISIWYLHRYRLRVIARQFNIRLEDRLRERTRIAQDLHDTLLQNIAGLCLQIGGLSKVITAAPESAQVRLKGLRLQGQECLREARQAVWDIRSLESERLDLAAELRVSGERLTSQTPARFIFCVDGEPRRIAPELREQLLRIGTEAIANSVGHAYADAIEVRIGFETKRISLRISDDGRGFTVDGASAPGHFGLTTMRERAQAIGASIVISSEPERGTSIEVTVPV